MVVALSDILADNHSAVLLTVSNLTGGIYTVTVIDALTSCSVTDLFTITQPPALTLNIAASSATACAGTSISFTATNSGGSPGPLPAYTYTWANGPVSNVQTVSQAAAGNYTYSVTSADGNGCSVTNSLVVQFVANPTISIANVSICPLQVATLTPAGASSYTWLPSGLTGSNFTDSPAFTTNYTFLGATAGCTTGATAIIILKPAPVPTVSNSGPLCEGLPLYLFSSTGSSYNWSGPGAFLSAAQNPTINLVTLNNNGVYTLTLTAANNCTAAASTTVTVYPTPTLTVLGSTVCTSGTLNLTANSVVGAFYLWSGPQSFTYNLQTVSIPSPSVIQSGTYTLTVTSTDNCTNTATVNAEIGPPPSLTVSLSSSSLCAQALNGSPNTITLTSSGAETFTLSTPNHISNPNPAGPASPLNMVPPYQPTGPTTATLLGSNGVCTVSTTVIFTIIPNPTVSINNFTPVICAGQTFTYTSAGANSYTWSAANPGNTLYTTGDVAVVNPSINSVFSVIGNSLGCNSAIQTSTLTVNPLPVFNANNVAMCPGTSANLVATGTASSYTWVPSSFLNTAIGATVVTSPPGDQTYVVTGGLNNCTVSAMVTVSLLSQPQPLLVAKQEVCLYDQISLQGFGGVTYEWFGPGQVYLTGQQVNYVAGNLNQSGTFTMIAAGANGCKKSLTTTILVKALPNGSVKGDQQGCVPFCTLLDLSATPSIKTDWLYNQQNTNGNNFKYCFNTPGTFTVNARLYDAVTTCSNVLGIEINVHTKPNANFTFYPELPVENLDEVVFTNTSEGGPINSFNWFFINNQGYRASSETVNCLFENAGVYPVALVIKNNFGCADSVVRAITVEPDFNLYMPNAFTPNEDGKNELFLPVARGISQYHLQIFDRWGAVVFTSNELNKGWDGSYKGQPAKSDVYVWKVDAVSLNGKTKNLTGHVTLYR